MEQKNPSKKVSPVIKGKARIGKPTIGQRLATEIKGDDTRPVKDFIIDTVIIPKAKDIASDIMSGLLETVRDTIDTTLFGAPRPRNKSGVRFQGSSSYNYNKVSDRDRRHRPKYENIFLSTRQEAQDVLNAMLDLIDEYGAVSVADLYELIGETCTYTDRKIGWDRLRTAEIIKHGREYLIDLPAPKQLD